MAKASIIDNRNLVTIAENYVEKQGDTGAKVVGRRGIIEQLKEEVERTNEVGEFDALVYVIRHNELESVEGQRVHFDIIKSPVLFNTEGNFEDNLVKYGIK